MIAYEKALPMGEGPNAGRDVVKKRKSAKKSRTEFYLVGGNLVVGGRRTTVRLEDEMWAALKDVAKREGYTVNGLAGRIDRRRKRGQSFTSAIRVFLLLYYRNSAR
jgi:predicted DNA-binding ribbon-helix-helix protein